MKSFALSILSLVCMYVTNAQQKEGKVIYSRTMQMQITMAGADQAMQQAMPRTRTDKFELLFGNNKSLLKHMDEESMADEVSGNGMVIRTVAAGQNDVVFHDFTTATRTDQREFFDKKFLVADTIQKLQWKITGETKNILGHTAQQAIATRIGTRMQMSMQNGNMERKEVADTTKYVAWFATSIPVPAGPEVQGQLPGLILALDVNNGRSVYQAIEISPKTDIAAIQPPSKGKKATPSEFITEREKMIKEMQSSGGGRGNRVIRM